MNTKSVGAPGRKFGRLLPIILAAFILCAFGLSQRQLSKWLQQYVVSIASEMGPANLNEGREPAASPSGNANERGKLKFAIMSSFVPNGGANPPPRLSEEYFEHIVNKACYCYIWGYDFIFNTTYAFDDTYTKKWHWLDFGTWHRVPHVESRIRDYDWILYTDTDFLIKNLMRPLDSFVHEFQLYGKNNVHLFVPRDGWNSDKMFFFSAFAFMIRNSPYGHSILKYWDIFARGMCENGNLNATSATSYHWLYTDQPGLWYAMLRTYADYFPDRVPEHNYPQCDNTTGLLHGLNEKKDHIMGGWKPYFNSIANLTVGSTGAKLANVPDDQPYIWSSPNGVGLQLNWGVGSSRADTFVDGAFAIHKKKVAEFPEGMKRDISFCRKHHKCYAHYNESGHLKIGCGGKVYL